METFKGIWEPDTSENIALIIGRQGKEKRVEECTERERERERECTHAGEKESVRKCFGSSSYMFLYVFPPPAPALCKLGLARSALSSA